MAKKQVNLSVGRGEFNFVEPTNEYYGVNGQVYCDFTKSGKHYVYAHFKKTDNELFYIGLGKFNRCNQISKRNKYWLNIYNKHGFLIRFLKVDLNKEEAIKYEREHILKYQPKANMTIGGESGNELCRKKVYCYDKLGSYKFSFNSISEANVFFNTNERDSRIVRCLKGSRLSFKGHIWKTYKVDAIPSYKRNPIHNIKKVYRYDLDGNFLREYSKVTDFKEGGHTGISNVIDKDNTYYNSFWRSFYSEKIICNAPKKALKQSIKLIDTKTNIIYESVSSAAKHIGCNRSVLQRKINGERINNTTFVLYEQKR
jgi:hypothetical protein